MGDRIEKKKKKKILSENPVRVGKGICFCLLPFASNCCLETPRELTRDTPCKRERKIMSNHRPNTASTSPNRLHFAILHSSLCHHQLLFKQRRRAWGHNHDENNYRLYEVLVWIDSNFCGSFRGLFCTIHRSTTKLDSLGNTYCNIDYGHYGTETSNL